MKFNSMKEFFTNEWQIIVGVAGSIIAWFTGRKMKKTNEKTAELENLSTIREMEKQLVEDAKTQADELREIIKEMQEIIDKKDSIILEQNKIIEDQLKALGDYKSKYE